MTRGGGGGVKNQDFYGDILFEWPLMCYQVFGMFNIFHVVGDGSLWMRWVRPLSNTVSFSSRIPYFVQILCKSMC